MPSRASPGSRGEKRLQLGVHGEARADLDLAVADARVEAVERADRRAAGRPCRGSRRRRRGTGR